MGHSRRTVTSVTGIDIGLRPETPVERELSKRMAEPAATEREKYLAGAIEYLRARLAAAEDALVVFSWTATDHSKRGKAAHELWLRWCHVSGFSSGAEEWPHLTDELIGRLAARRDAMRKATLSKLYGDQP